MCRKIMEIQKFFADFGMLAKHKTNAFFLLYYLQNILFIDILSQIIYGDVFRNISPVVNVNFQVSL